LAAGRFWLSGWQAIVNFGAHRPPIAKCGAITGYIISNHLARHLLWGISAEGSPLGAGGCLNPAADETILNSKPD